MRMPDALPSLAMKLGFAATLMACALGSAFHRSTDPVAMQAASELPSSWDGHPLRPLALSPVEQRFAAQFPGHVTRLTDGLQVLVWRDVQRPTRMLHPAADCYRGLGYRIEQARLEQDAQDRLWRCFTATRQGQHVRVCERIVDAKGQAFTDASSWFWAAQLGQSTGPWQAVTLARNL